MKNKALPSQEAAEMLLQISQRENTRVVQQGRIRQVVTLAQVSALITLSNVGFARTQNAAAEKNLYDTLLFWTDMAIIVTTVIVCLYLLLFVGDYIGKNRRA